MLPIDLSTADLPELHVYLRKSIKELYDCRNEDDKAWIFKEKATNIAKEIHRRWILNG